MHPEPPMQLRRHDSLIGRIVSYGYETPWASGRIVPTDPVQYAQLARVDAFVQWAETLPDTLPDAEADARYDAELAARGLTQALVDEYGNGWAITLPDGSTHAVSSVMVGDDQVMIWRW